MIHPDLLNGTPMSEEVDIESRSRITFKRCPYCFTSLRLDATRCLECKQKVGKMDKFGLAKKPLNIKAYLASLLWLVMLGLYIWKIFIGKFLADQ